MTAEELLRLCDRIISSGGFDTLTSVDRCTIARALRDRLTDSQAQRIAELEAQIAARGPDREKLAQLLLTMFGPKLTPDVRNLVVAQGFPSEATWGEWLKRADALLSSGALATAQAEQSAPERLPAGSYMSRQKTAEDYERINAAPQCPGCGKAYPEECDWCSETIPKPEATAQAVTLTEEERRIMGTLEDAHATLLEKWRAWTQYTGPAFADRKTHRERDAARREAEVRLREAAATVAWHLNRLTNGASTP